MKHAWKRAMVLSSALLSTVILGQAASAASYTVQPGDTLYHLSKQTGTSVYSWKLSNHLQGSAIRVGQKLEQPMSYKISAGDTMWGLSKRYGTSVADLMKVNGKTSSYLRVGEVLIIPVGSTRVASQPAASYQQNAQTVAGHAYARSVNAVASAYGPGNIMWQWGGHTYTGTKVRPGVIAVDPSVIPLGSKVWVTGYTSPLLPAGGFVATAEDTGGAIKGNRIDIYINSNQQSLRQFGLQDVQVYVLK